MCASRLTARSASWRRRAAASACCACLPTAPPPRSSPSSAAPSTPTTSPSTPTATAASSSTAASPKTAAGIYPFAIGCDDSITVGERVLATKLLSAFAYLPPAGLTAAAVARELPGALSGEEAHLLDLGPPLLRLGGAPTFGDPDASVSVGVPSPDGRHLFVGDFSEFTDVPNRVAVIDLAGPSPELVQTATPVLDPIDIVPSPDGDAVLIVSGYGNILRPFVYAPDAPAPLGAAGPTIGSALPGSAVLVSRGAARGVVLVSEVNGIRLVRFTGGAGLADLGIVSTGTGTAGLPGAIGVQP
jgi:hypothetical protein